MSEENEQKHVNLTVFQPRRSRTLFLKNVTLQCQNTIVVSIRSVFMSKESEPEYVVLKVVQPRRFRTLFLKT